jgi:hypothetical protein
MGLKDRKTLKGHFKKGLMPTEAGFEDLIDSSLNCLEDGISRDISNGMKIAPANNQNSIISFFRSLVDKNPLWNFQFDPEIRSASPNKNQPKGIAQGLTINEVTQVDSATVRNDSRIFLEKGGNVGIGCLEPSEKLEVDGNIASRGRIGIKGSIPADGNWYTVVEGLTHGHGFEIVARTGAKNTGRHALVHAIALSTFGRSDYAIRKTQARFSFWKRCAIKIRFTGELKDYKLQLRSRTDEGAENKVYFHICSLWDDTDHFSDTN